MSNQSSIEVSILMGSDSDLPLMKKAAEALDRLGVSNELKVLSAHRTPAELLDYLKGLESRNTKVIIAGAGGAAHLPGVIAAHTLMPVIGVPIPNGPLNGQDALYSIVQMPRGIPVACTAIGGTWNAGLLAAHIMSVDTGPRGSELREKLANYREEMRKAVLSKNV